MGSFVVCTGFFATLFFKKTAQTLSAYTRIKSRVSPKKRQINYRKNNIYTGGVFFRKGFRFEVDLFFYIIQGVSVSQTFFYICSDFARKREHSWKKFFPEIIASFGCATKHRTQNAVIQECIGTKSIQRKMSPNDKLFHLKREVSKRPKETYIVCIMCTTAIVVAAFRSRVLGPLRGKLKLLVEYFFDIFWCFL